jgi:5-methylcytosine-specific restriction enzyme A
MFNVGQSYTKNEIYKILDVPIQRRKGAWDTGYREYEGNIFIFSNVGVPGRTGHDYDNYWDGELFVWQAKTASNINQPLIRKMLNPEPTQQNFLFTRTDDKDPFTFEGSVIAKEYNDTTPVSVIWQLTGNYYYPLEEPGSLPYEVNQKFVEGSVKRILINKYERNPVARRICLNYYGVHCQICDFDFYKTYGEIGRNFIHVHHIIPFSQITEEYELDPVKDLIPVCPNCHSMIHRNLMPLSVIKIKELINKNNY